MILLPIKLEHKLKELFPRADDRNKFVAGLIEEALEGDRQQTHAEDQPVSIGGTVHLFTDGGSRGNPGQAAVGVVLEDPTEGVVLKEHYERIGIETNNVAEYMALIKGLQLVQDFHPNHLVCHLDSELVVKQLNGEYKVKMPSLQPLVQQIHDLSKDFAHIQFQHIPRRDNFRADALVNKALDTLPDPPYER